MNKVWTDTGRAYRPAKQGEVVSFQVVYSRTVCVETLVGLKDVDTAILWPSSRDNSVDQLPCKAPTSSACIRLCYQYALLDSWPTHDGRMSAAPPQENAARKDPGPHDPGAPARSRGRKRSHPSDSIDDGVPPNVKLPTAVSHIHSLNNNNNIYSVNKPVFVSMEVRSKDIYTSWVRTDNCSDVSPQAFP